MAEAAKVGRPSDYRPEFCQAIMEAPGITELGATDTAIASALGVDVRTIYRWKEQFSEFAETCAVLKGRADDVIEASLFHRGRGYAHDAVKIFMPAGAAEPVYAPYTERYPPDTQAASLWLRNRRPKDWRDRVEHTGADGGPIELTWMVPQPGEAGPTALPGDSARDVTPRAGVAPVPAVLDGEAIAVEWGGEPAPDPVKPKRGKKS